MSIFNRDPNFFYAREFRSILKSEYEVRQKRRTSYSLRAFARDLGIKPATLNGVLAGRFGISRAVAEKLAACLQFSTREAEFFCDLVESRHARTKLGRQHAKLRLAKYRTLAEFSALEHDAGELLEKWYYAAVLEIITNYGGKLKSAQIAARLQISETEAESALRCLRKHGLIKKTPRGYISRKGHLRATSQAPSAKIRGWHRQFIEMSTSAIEAQPIDQRKFTSTVLSFDKAKIERARQWLSKMHQEFLDEFATEKIGNSVYAFSFQFFQLDGGATDET